MPDHDTSSVHHSHSRRHRSRSRDRHRESSGRHHSHRSSRSHRSHSRNRDSTSKRDRDRDQDRHRHHRRRKRSRDDTDRERHHKLRKQTPEAIAATSNIIVDDDADEWVEAEAEETISTLNKSPIPTEAPQPAPKRDAWMLEPSALDIDYTQRGSRKKTPPKTSTPDYAPIIHKNELNKQLVAGKSLEEYTAPSTDAVTYTFGDEGSKWRMSKLRRVYEFAKEEGRTVDDVALERYGDLKLFDNAREEEMELERRETYGRDRVDAKDQPTGELYAERVRKMEVTEKLHSERQGRILETLPSKSEGTAPATATGPVVSQSTLNRMRAALMKAQLRGDPKAPEMEKEYNAALTASRQPAAPQSDTVVLSAMDTRQIAGLSTRVGREVVETKNGKLVENADMSISDMVRAERLSKNQSSSKEFAERISRDAKFNDDLEYMDENAEKLAKRIQKNEISIKNMAVNEYKKVSRILDQCPLCEHEDRPPLASVISLATRVFLSLPPEPEVVQGGAVIVPIQHHKNMLECDDDEWEEVRNFMKSLTRHYAALNPPQSVIFYESSLALHSHPHAYITAVPLPGDVQGLAPAYFKEAILASAPEWSTHQKILSTENKGKMGFRRTMSKDMPYFHVWFTIDGGMGHVVEDERLWPRGDGFAREVLAGMIGAEKEVVRKRGRWGRNKEREEKWKRGWDQWDWSKVLVG
ncbi:hypothetical protein EX30DRAFT_339137 [Ascodesmis nigricans]|uniref:Cell cycle control protein n=1 Tax=Ascodesmis nigricans TaxID=341454 RepID=A0A4S2N171_9PEZI|nr:hypothetical protein EX30DRAFT_339137 [Ascodesmis nigricans]